ncbi:MAG: glycerophosphodiester phosphodiesterase family protein [Acetobacteraceae bacterium]|nr:glycerophosphodiester phosphodiesterase family protein [Acetobacteraceae bacterium]
MVDLQGHRFARGLFPENTLEGFEAACALGLDSFEIDIAVTRDGIPVLHHDPALNPNTTRGPDGQWLTATGPLIRELSLAELQRYDVGRVRPGSDYAAAFPEQIGRDGVRIPTLSALLAKRQDVRLNIELKLMPARPEWTVVPEEMVERVMHAVDAADAAARISLQSFDWRAPRHLRRVRPEIARGWLTEAKTVRDAALWRGIPGTANTMDAVPDAIVAEGGGHWAPHHSDLTLDLLSRAHALGLRVIPWTVNEPSDMRRLFAWGVDGLITDWPDRALPLRPASG